MLNFRKYLLVFLLLWITFYKPAVSHRGSCEDHTSHCRFWAYAGRCQWDETMKENCPVSCNVCIDRNCFDRDSNCATWSQQGYCLTDPIKYLGLCPHSCDSCIIPLSPATQQYFYPWLYWN
ncbi:putative tyrosinase-like protein tyr-3 [Penaeus japonicus]|uniref:putative tyrosinase-like protein tyr-3 n=1 Tax=Penaeus japonicus TaxID=27405 RepID=UPI001C715358|nr:putative tyrosinase-like protein tyr-3 [Penaeus japonicus]